jgi:8-oxo-dGTP pyrophosphatase MutT (NUDIX family)/phosphohistidine phosphatase SixA
MPNNKPGSRLIRAAGGVAWRPGRDGEPEILLVHRKKYDDWSLPKGKTEPDEPLPVTAVREVLEEGGARLALGRRLVSVRYNVGGRPKRVHYWAARVLSVDARAVPNSEVDEVTWLPADRAVGKVSYPHDHGVLADFAARPAQTVPLILLRHSKAVPKSGWKRTDKSRPLDDSGRSDAKALADLLACFAPRPRLITSTAARCADTLRPLSEVTGEQVRAEPALYIHNQTPLTGEADPAADLIALVREVIAAGEPAVICAHRENLPLLQEAALAVLTGHAARPTSGAVAAGGPGDAIAQLPREWDEALPTSGFWVLNVAPPPSAEAPAGPDEGPPLPADLVTPPPSAARPWWRRLLAGLAPARDASASGHPGADGRQAGPAVAAAGADAPGGDAAASGEAPSSEAASAEAGPDASAGPVGVLVSADRYDLSES